MNKEQRMVALGQSEHAPTVIALLTHCRTTIHNIVGKTEYDTVINAARLEFEGEFILRVESLLKDLKLGNIKK
jgi:hypothetical protein